VLFLLYVVVSLSVANLVMGKADRMAGARNASVILTTSLALVFAPYCERKFAN
jgi:hypothetical protein